MKRIATIIIAALAGLIGLLTWPWSRKWKEKGHRNES